MQNHDRLQRVNDVYTYERQYPFDDEIFLSVWNKEGSLLAEVLRKKEEAKAYRIVRNRLQSDFSRRIRKLGDQHGDLRFYLSGAIQAMILVWQ